MNSMEELKFKLEQKNPLWSSYDVIFNRDCTLKEFAECVIKNTCACGDILVFKDKEFIDVAMYSCGELFWDFEVENLKYLQYKVKKATTNGGIIKVNYTVYI